MSVNRNGLGSWRAAGLAGRGRGSGRGAAPVAPAEAPRPGAAGIGTVLGRASQPASASRPSQAAARRAACVRGRRDGRVMNQDSRA
jgi:hypothetical protein